MSLHSTHLRKPLHSSHVPNSPSRPASKTPKSAKRSRTGDRFIASRSHMDVDLARMTLQYAKKNAATSSTSTTSSENSVFAAKLQSSVLFNQSPTAPAPQCDLAGAKILSFATKAPLSKAGSVNAQRSLFSQASTAPARSKKAFRRIPTTATKVLDAPGMQQDFYLNLLDWGASGALAVALDDTVYLWNHSTGSIEQLCDAPSNGASVTSVAWDASGRHLAVGFSTADVQIWDARRSHLVRSWRDHSGRVSSLAWRGAALTTGGADARILNNDVRAARHRFASLAGHTQEVCGLRWSPNGSQLASGANDNTVCVWGASASTPDLRLDAHAAAVKALAWCPHRSNLLATGGGTADQHVRFWNTASGVCVKSANTHSQVSGLAWSPNEMEIVSSHGFAQNQLTVWKYSSMARMAELKGHSERVLHLAQSPDGSMVVSGGADETLRFWNVFETTSAGRSQAGARNQSRLNMEKSRHHIR